LTTQGQRQAIQKYKQSNAGRDSKRKAQQKYRATKRLNKVSIIKGSKSFSFHFPSN